MAFSKVATATFSIAKELKTFIFVRTGKKLLSIGFIRRNRLAIICGVILWLAATISGYFIYDSTRVKYIENLYRQGTSAVKELAAISGTHLLENDILKLNAMIRDFLRGKDIEFITILDHRDFVVAHTRPEMIDQPFYKLSGKKPLDIIDGVIISSGTDPEGNEIILFSKKVEFSGINIGKIHLAFSKTVSDNTLWRYRVFFILGLASVTLSLTIVLLVKDRFTKAKADKFQREVEGMGKIGPYVLRKKIGQGGMAELFLADYVGEDGFRRTVALKKVLPHLMEYPEFSKMFIREARVAALLQHPNIVQVIDYKKIDHTSFMAMEFICGKTLGQLLVKAKERLPYELCIFIILKVCNALHYAHSRKNDETGEPLNIIHRDICPQNLLLSYQGEVKLADFGISKIKSETSLTQPGVIKGKISYIAPEQFLGKPLNHQADIYSLGVVFYEILTGRKLNKFDTETEAFDRVKERDVKNIEGIGEDLPSELNRIVMKCLESDSELRYESALALKNDLESVKKQYHIVCDESDLAAYMKEHFKDEAETA
jgi:tRNA A-37 threonylcarbamoyl transferase component Bud32